MTDDPFKSKEFLEYAEHVKNNLIPRLTDSALTISIAPTDGSAGDVKFAVELGFSIMLNKPIILVAAPGQSLSPALVRVADEVLRYDITTDIGQKKLALAMTKVFKRYDIDDPK